MITLTWVACYEGSSDRAYFDVLIPRILADLTLKHGQTQTFIPRTPAFEIKGREIGKVAEQACEGREAAKIFFVHADTGGRALEANIRARSNAFCEEMSRRCKWPPACCVSLTPRKETEAWVLADGEAVMETLRLRGEPRSVGLPNNASLAEALPDPKRALEGAIRLAAGRRSVPDRKIVFASVAQRQALDQLRRSESYRTFESRVFGALAFLRVVQHL